MCFFVFFFFNDTATTEIYTLSLHDALPILEDAGRRLAQSAGVGVPELGARIAGSLLDGLANEETTGDARDRKSTRLNSSHDQISYAVFCLKKKQNQTAKSTACT